MIDYNGGYYSFTTYKALCNTRWYWTWRLLLLLRIHSYSLFVLYLYSEYGYTCWHVGESIHYKGRLPGYISKPLKAPKHMQNKMVEKKNSYNCLLVGGPESRHLTFIEPSASSSYSIDTQSISYFHCTSEKSIG